jgi:hypothetical protein
MFLFLCCFDYNVKTTTEEPKISKNGGCVCVAGFYW